MLDENIILRPLLCELNNALLCFCFGIHSLELPLGSCSSVVGLGAYGMLPSSLL
ncbi:unnamed protein product [Brassica oleracea var. botrytis]